MKRDTASNGLAPNANVLERVRQVFAQAAVDNPDGDQGINLHLELGNEVPYDGDLNPYQTEFFALKSAQFDPRRAPVFHYMIWANGYDGDTSSGISMGIPHSDFVVTLGVWNGGNGGTEDQKVGTFIHELGHNLGLTHGGVGDHTHYKPNHLSLMNYAFQTRGIRVLRERRFDYQRFPLPALRETSLSESVGLGDGPNIRGYWTMVTGRELDASGSIDWNGDGRIDDNPIRVDLNGDEILGDLLAVPNQWSVLVYNGGSIGSLRTLEGALETARSTFHPFPYRELTEQVDRQLQR